MNRKLNEDGSAKKQGAGLNRALDPFLDLTWEDLEEWAGKRIVSRGRSYQGCGAVQDLVRPKDRGLVARVEGTRRYTTRVSIHGEKTLKSACTCPYWTTCKHAVAVVLEYLACVRTGGAAEEVAENDPRLKQPGFGQEDFDDLQETGISTTDPLHTYLRECGKTELVSLMFELVQGNEEARQWLEDRRALTLGRKDEILRAIRREIEALEEPAWIHDQYGSTAPEVNVGHIKAALEGLVKAGHAAEAVRLGPELLSASGEVINYDYEGEACDAISACLEVLFEALNTAFPSPEDQVEWVLDMVLVDRFGQCGEGLEHFWGMPRPGSDWSAMRDWLKRRLEAHEMTDSHGYERNQISNWLILTLERTGCENEIIPLCEREAPITLSYDRLVARLIRERRWDEALRWCLRGMDAVSDKNPGVEEILHRQLRTIHELSGNPLAGLAIEAEKFFASPDLSGFQHLCMAAGKQGIGKGVEAWARHFLETGRRPDSVKKTEIDPETDWPLPASEIKIPEYSPATEPPMTGILIRLAISENKPEEALKWYDHEHHDRGGSHLLDFSLDTEVAEAVRATHPDRAIAVWKNIAEKHIAQVQRRGYEAAAPYLRKVKKAFIQTNRKQDWEAYLASLRKRNSRRPRCMEVLDRLKVEPRRIIDT